MVGSRVLGRFGKVWNAVPIWPAFSVKISKPTTCRTFRVTLLAQEFEISFQILFLHIKIVCVGGGGGGAPHHAMYLVCKTMESIRNPKVLCPVEIRTPHSSVTLLLWCPHDIQCSARARITRFWCIAGALSRKMGNIGKVGGKWDEISLSFVEKWGKLARESSKNALFGWSPGG